MTTNVPEQWLPAFPFPAISWWKDALAAGNIGCNPHEPYRKMSGNNRYYLAGPQGKQGLSIPLKGGRQQKRPISEVAIFYEDDWQRQHWKTLTTLYRNAPFFAFFAPEIQELYQQRIQRLLDWNLRSIQLVIRLLELDLKVVTAPPAPVAPDSSQQQTHHHPLLPVTNTEQSPLYHQVFDSRVAFQPDCSILDLLFCEGMYARILLKSRAGR